MRSKSFSYQSVRWFENTFGSAFLAIIWAVSNPFGDEPSLD
ncbi:MAG: hypothetical protein NW224_17840 [Leptolyngbyaceae cyanobacterium bins.302]|nr:hypothetical protein [Leptolyngbyaceae cyanobacterium bins.302]